MKDAKKYVPLILVALIAAGAGFWGGNAYAASKRMSAGVFARGAGAPGNFNGGFAGRNGGQPGQGGAALRNGGRGGAGPVSGEVLSLDDKSLTVKLQDGGSKIVLLSAASTKIYRSEEIKATDVAVGDQVMVNGTPNDDGSVTANMVQVRPKPPVIDETGAREIKISASKFKFDPAEVRVKQGEKIKLTLTNADGMHGLDIPAFNVSLKPAEGQSASQVFIADQKGTFPFFCSTFCGEGHRDMQGSLIVE
ncbi:MAG TPA: cupredoxin domain-containing protein [Patescibacteria group bacterium]|nr:cupredoxin domain-containing protein [Patescibacteria group bacterium]